jgi:catechol 2,3-dioxygenase-like lactoylglutathione lyase family enzyme
VSSLRFSSISVPTRDLDQSKRFFTEVLGGELASDGDTPTVRFGKLDIILGPQDGGATEPEMEHPHYAFELPPDQFARLKHRLEAFGVPTHDPWGRVGQTHSLMYFRDPSGNQFEMYCTKGDTGIKLRIGARAGGDYEIPFTSLVYERLGDSAADAPELGRTAPLDVHHLTLPAADLAGCRSFFMEIFGGQLLIDAPDHVSVVLGGFHMGYGGPLDRGAPAPDAEYPHYTVQIAPGELVPMKERLAAFGVPTSDVWTTDGVDASFYFRDPAGHLWKLACKQGIAGTVRRRSGAGGDYTPNLRALCYESWNDPGA